MRGLRRAVLALAMVLAFVHPSHARRRHRPAPRPHPVVGVASYYGWRFHGRRMANGRRFNALDAVVASRTLPLNTKVRVTNLENGRTVVAWVEDRGPYVPGRCLDVSLGVARMLGIVKQGLTRVRVDPIG